MTKYLDKKFSSPANSKKYVDNYDKVFGIKCDNCGLTTYPKEETYRGCPDCTHIGGNYG